MTDETDRTDRIGSPSGRHRRRARRHWEGQERRGLVRTGGRRRTALMTWLRGEREDDAVLVPAQWAPCVDRHEGPARAGECWSVQELVYALWDDPTGVPSDVACLLGLDDDVSVSTLVRWMHAQRLERGCRTHAETVEELTGDAQRRITPDMASQVREVVPSGWFSPVSSRAASR